MSEPTCTPTASTPAPVPTRPAVAPKRRARGREAELNSTLMQLLALLADFDAASLRTALDGDVTNYVRLVNAAARLSESSLKYERYRAEVKERKAKLEREVNNLREGGLSEEALERIQEQLNLL